MKRAIVGGWRGDNPCRRLLSLDLAFYVYYAATIIHSWRGNGYLDDLKNSLVKRTDFNKP